MACVTPKIMGCLVSASARRALSVDDLAALAFAAGAALLQLQAALPGARVGAGAAAARAPRCAGGCRSSCRRAVGLLLGGVLAQWRMADWLAPELEGRDIAVVGVVASLPAIAERGVRFELDVESPSGAAAGEAAALLVSQLRDAGRRPAPCSRATCIPGERWAFTVRLRRPHGHVNPHGFDYEAWLLERGIGATGYVRPRGEQRRLGSRDSPLDRIERVREAVRDRFIACSARRRPPASSRRLRWATSARFRARTGASSTAPASRT